MPTIEEIKARLQGLNSKTKKGRGFARPKDEHDYRLVRNPHASTGADPFVTLYFHENIDGMDKHLCPQKNYGDECEPCAAAEQLKAWKGPDGKDKPESERKKDFELFKKIDAKARVLVARLERGKESEGLMWWDMTPKVSLEVIEFCTSAQRLEMVKSKDALDVLFGEDAGYDIHVSVAPPGKKGNTTGFHQIKTKMDQIIPSKLADNGKIAEQLKSTLMPLEEVFPRVTTEQMSKIWKKFIGTAGLAVEDAPGGDTPATERYAGNHAEDASKPGGKSIDEAFEDLVANKAAVVAK